MTSQALNRPVDVLQVMDEAAYVLSKYGEHAGFRLNEARAAVAELIVEAKRAEYMLRDMAEAGFGDPRQADGLRITLARIGGAK